MTRHHMVSMRLTEKQRKEIPETLSTSKREFPFGLEIRLDGESLEKLQLPGLPSVDDVFDLAGIAKVTSVSSVDRPDGPSEKHVSLQITDLGLYPSGERSEDAVTPDKFYAVPEQAGLRKEV